MSKTENKKKQMFKKEAFLNAAKSTNERLLLQVLLTDEKSYTKSEVTKLVNDWKKKEISSTKEAEA